MILFCFINVSSFWTCVPKGHFYFQTIFVCLGAAVIFHIPLAIAFMVPFLEDSMATSAALEVQPSVSLIFCNTA